MKISIITVCFNSEKTIRDTIESVLKQTYRNFEYIIIDGQSTDSTLSIINEYEDVILVSEKDNGLYDAMNKGIKKATGDIIGIINSDDVLYDENVFQTIIDNYDDDTEILYGDVKYYDEDFNEVIRDYISGKKKNDAWCPAHPTMYIRKEVFDKIGLYDTKFRIVSDYDYIVNATKYGILPPIDYKKVNPNSKIIDLSYVDGDEYTTFINEFLKNGHDEELVEDGFGILVRQAFESYKIWGLNNVSYKPPKY